VSFEKIKPLSIEEKVGQLFVIGITGPTIDAPTRDLLERVMPGGVCLFARNIREASQTRALLDEIRELSPIEPILCLDQEGGLVDRLRRVVTPMPAPSDVQTIEDAAAFGALVADVVRLLGFNLNFAPVVDLSLESRRSANNGLFSRTFGRSPQETIELAGAFLTSMQARGCLGCIKHFPGLGAAAVDSHEELPSVEIDNDVFENADLLPFRELIAARAAAAVMVAHAAYPKSDLQETDLNGKLLPSSLSYNFVTHLLRETLGFTGLVFTDDLEMGAILANYGIADACVRAANAGNDMLAICADGKRIVQGFEAVLAAVASGEIGEGRVDESLIRIAELKNKLLPPPAFDQAQLASLSADIAIFKDRSK